MLLSFFLLKVLLCILEGFVGTDFFTFKLQLGSLSSILATIAITVDNDLTKAKKITDQRKLGANVLRANRRSSLLNTFRNSMAPGSLLSSPPSEAAENTQNPMVDSHDDRINEVEMSERGRGRNLTMSHEVNESFNL
jgi:hypothetical protein